MTRTCVVVQEIALVFFYFIQLEAQHVWLFHMAYSILRCECACACDLCLDCVVCVMQTPL